MTSDMSEGYRGASSPNRPMSAQGQPVIGHGQHPAAPALDDHVVLDPDSAPSGDIDPRLDRDDHALLEDGGSTRIETGILMHFQAQAVPDPVYEAVPQSTVADHGSGGLVNLAHGRARPYRGDPGVVGAENQRVHLTLAGVGLA